MKSTLLGLVYLLNDFENLAVIALSDDELVHVLLTLDVDWSKEGEVFLADCLLPGTDSIKSLHL